MRLDPSNLTSTAVYSLTTLPKIPNYHVTVQNSRDNQILGDSGILCGILQNDGIHISFMHKFQNLP